MKNLIRKILKEQEDEFEWIKDLDVNAAEKEIKKSYRDMEYEHSFEGEDLYSMLIDAGVHDLEKLKEIGDFIYTEVSGVNQRGYDSGRDDCGCEGCCDDYVYEDEVSDREDTAREEGRESGYDDGYEEGVSKSEAEIEELRGQINDLQYTIEELQSRLSSSDDDLS